MARIDRETVRKILDTADIVEVVSDFVQLKRRGANYIGLCPFHNERTPSFSVSKSKGYCKCFSCGKGGSAVGFIMELEQMSYSDALRYLANKYHIEIKEHELTAEEQEAESNRESMFAINDFAMRYFEDTLLNTEDGRNIGLSYFRERGINDDMIRRFHLGYSPQGRHDLADWAVAKGYNERFLLETGLCYRTDRGVLQDRFRGRVMYPVQSMSGKVVAFGGRTLSRDKSVAKYVNSPESTIYKKSNELYGLFQAKRAIVNRDKCILVEGYMDVISMHQSGVENVVASSGTSLTEGQIRLIHRFTNNVTVIYDSDAAGIKASLRGIDMLLAEGMNVRVLLLPEGDDPDSFAQSHTSTEVEQYLADNEVDFISFKTRILLDDTKGDPIMRAKAISSIVWSIAKIPDQITRVVYIGECARVLGIDEKVLATQCTKYIAEQAEARGRQEQRERNAAQAGLTAPTIATSAADYGTSQQGMPQGGTTTTPAAGAVKTDVSAPDKDFLAPYERELVRLVMRYGTMYLCDNMDDDGNRTPMDVITYVEQELGLDNIEPRNEQYAKAMRAVRDVIAEGWEESLRAGQAEIEAKRKKLMQEGIDGIRREAKDVSSVNSLEAKLKDRVDGECATAMRTLCETFLTRALMSSADDGVRALATDLCVDKYALSRIHTKYAHVAGENERLADLVPRAVYNLKEAIVECEIRALNGELMAMNSAHSSAERVAEIMTQLGRLNDYKIKLSKYLGERVLTPHKR